MKFRRLLIFSVLVESSVYFLRDEKYIPTIFLSFHRPAKIYIKSNLRMSGSCCT